MVPNRAKAELSAYIHHLHRTLIPGSFIGDCQQVIDAAQFGVSARQRSATSFHADLWREAHRAQQDHGPGLKARKTKAHRSLAAAAISVDDPTRFWHGNFAADEAAKSLAKSLAHKELKVSELLTARIEYAAALQHVAYGAAWFFTHWPSSDGKGSKRRQRHQFPADDDGGADQCERAGHNLVEYSTRAWECTNCKLKARGAQGWRAIGRRQCRGPPAQQAHPTHEVRVSGSVTWCNSCGAFTVRWPRALRMPCAGQPQSAAQRHVLHRLRLGMAPTTAMYLKDITDRDDTDGTKTTSRPTPGKHTAPTSQHHVGKYLRLPGGPLHRPPRPTLPKATFDNGDDDYQATSPRVHADGGSKEYPHRASRDIDRHLSETNVHVRRRIRGKQRPTGTSRAASVDTANAIDGGTRRTDSRPQCAPNQTGPWCSRLKCEPTAAPASCHICGRQCRAVCRGCHQKLCIHCARNRAGCIVHEPSSGHGFNFHHHHRASHHHGLVGPPCAVHASHCGPPADEHEPSVGQVFNRSHHHRASHHHGQEGSPCAVHASQSGPPADEHEPCIGQVFNHSHHHRASHHHGQEGSPCAARASQSGPSADDRGSHHRCYRHHGLSGPP